MNITPKFRATKCYQIITPESAEVGDIEESGFEFEDEPFTFTDAVRLLRDEASFLSDDPCVYESTWAISEPSLDYRTGEETSYSFHFRNMDNTFCTPLRIRRLYRAAHLLRERSR